MKPVSVADQLRALNPEDLSAAYKRGRRRFRAINLLRRELEANYGDSRRFDSAEHPDATKWNPLWLDYQGLRDCSWDQSGRCLFEERDDLPDARNLSNLDLHGIDLQGSYLYPVDFSHTSLKGADLKRCILIDCDLSSADLSRTDLREARIHHCVLRDANFYMARMDRCHIWDCDARNVNLHRAKLKKTLLLRLDLRGSVLNGHFDRSWLKGSDLRGVDLSTVTLSDAVVDGIIVSPAQKTDLLKALNVTLRPAKSR